VESLAKFHSFWWGHSDLGTRVGRWVSEFSLRRTVGFVQTHWPVLLNRLKDSITEAEKLAVTRITDSALMVFRERLAERHSLTLVHGDAHAMNFLVPSMEQMDNTAYILDWQTPGWLWQVSFGVSDLAYFMVRFWSPRRRSQVEEDLLRSYLMELENRNVKNYSWDDLFYDYRLSVVLCLFVAVHEASSRQSTAWFPQLENCLAAILELDCLELFA
jgi:hypothetical protein